jgi:hypothetical protein
VLPIVLVASTATGLAANAAILFDASECRRLFGKRLNSVLPDIFSLLFDELLKFFPAVRHSQAPDKTAADIGCCRRG